MTHMIGMIRVGHIWNIM